MGAVLRDYSQLVKLKLSLLVVFSSVAGYMIVAGSLYSIGDLILLFLGGFCTTGAANTLNQVLEKDYDRLMRRTQDRPLAQGRMKVSEAVLFAGLMCLIGILFLATFNPITAMLGMLSLVLYAFVYTPVKRYSTSAVAIGAIPGALPILIGCTAFEGNISYLALSLFMLQFIWQFPHFWSIGFLGYEDYKNAGYRLMPMGDDGEVDSSLGFQVFAYSLLLLPITIIMYHYLDASVLSTGISFMVALMYIYYSFKFYKHFDLLSARKTMFASFIYLPIMQIAYWIF